MKYFNLILNFIKKTVWMAGKRYRPAPIKLWLRNNVINRQKQISYENWIKETEPSQKDLQIQKNTKFTFMPKISIIVPVWNTPKQFLIDMIESILNQTYSNWELCLADGGSSVSYIKEILETYRTKDNRIRVKYLTENKGITINSKEALTLASGDYIALVDHDDILAPFALFEVVEAINENPDTDFIY